jgi:hypothetical protein
MYDNILTDFPRLENETHDSPNFFFFGTLFCVGVQRKKKGGCPKNTPPEPYPLQ